MVVVGGARDEVEVVETMVEVEVVETMVEVGVDEDVVVKGGSHFTGQLP